jgi:hypothetical protein
MKCINCNIEVYENFCPNCGEKSKTPKITFKSILNATLSTITNMDKGFLFNVKNLFIKPNDIVNDYIRGKRKNIFNPISFLIISVTTYLILDSLIGVTSERIVSNSKLHSFGIETGRFLKSQFKYFWVLSIIWLCIPTKLIFGKYNFAEHLAINYFVIGQSTLVGILGFVLFKIPIIFNPIIYIFIIWMTYKIFKDKEKGKDKVIDVLIQAFSCVVIFFLQLLLIVAIIGFVKSQA